MSRQGQRIYERFFKPKPQPVANHCEVAPESDTGGIPGMTNEILPFDVVRAVFLKWEIECRLDPNGFTPRDELVMQSADKVADKNARCFIQYAEEMGIRHE